MSLLNAQISQISVFCPLQQIFIRQETRDQNYLLRLKNVSMNSVLSLLSRSKENLSPIVLEEQFPIENIIFLLSGLHLKPQSAVV